MPFDEDTKENDVWFLDHDYLENMYSMFKKVNGKCIKKILYVVTNIFLRNDLCVKLALTI